MKKTPFKSGFIALVGRPNAGKSTLLNTILGEDLAVVTPLPQTTRKNCRGIYTTKSCQLVFVDTPGMHKGDYNINEFMMKESCDVLKDKGVDVIGYIVDLYRDFGEEEKVVASQVKAAGIPVVLIFNKVDLVPDAEARIAAFDEEFPSFTDVNRITIAATEHKSADIFLDSIMSFIPEGPMWFPEEDLTDENLRYFAAEYLRKGIILNTSKEVPHASFVEIIDYKETEKRHTIEAVIHVETRGQRGIVVGKNGDIINKIKRIARNELHRLTGAHITYKVHVKITPKWRNSDRFLNQMGYAQNSG